MVFSKIVAELIAEAGRYRVVGFTQDGDQISEFLGLPVVPFEKLEESFPPNEFHALVAVGYSKMNQVRQQKYLEQKARGYSMGSCCCHASISPQRRAWASITLSLTRTACSLTVAWAIT